MICIWKSDLDHKKKLLKIHCLTFYTHNTDCVFVYSPQPKLYRSVIEDVISEVRELFLDEGVDEQVLLELKTVTLMTR